MWKEKYEAAVADNAKFVKEQHLPLVEAHDALAQRVLHLEGKNGSKEDPGILQVSVEAPQLRVDSVKPEIQVHVKRKTIEMDGSTVQGMIAVLLSEGFFDETKTGAAVVTELRRRGLSFGDATAYNRCGDIAGMGFLTREGKGSFRAVAGMKVNIVEARA